MKRRSRDQPRGRRRKPDMVAVEAQRDLCVLRGRRALLLDLLATGSATADDVWDAVAIPKGVDRRCLGSVPRLLARLGIIRSAGRVRSVRPDCHGSPIHLWQLADRGAAERWLRDHPDRPENGPATISV